MEKLNNFDRDVYWRNNGSIVNVNIFLTCFKQVNLVKVACGGRAGASPGHQPLSEQCPLLQVCVHLDGSNTENTFHC